MTIARHLVRGLLTPQTNVTASCNYFHCVANAPGSKPPTPLPCKHATHGSALHLPTPSCFTLSLTHDLTHKFLLVLHITRPTSQPSLPAALHTVPATDVASHWHGDVFLASETFYARLRPLRAALQALQCHGALLVRYVLPCLWLSAALLTPMWLSAALLTPTFSPSTSPPQHGTAGFYPLGGRWLSVSPLTASHDHHS